MLKVLLVDDEYYFKEGMKQLIPWEQEGYQVVGDAANASAAMELAQLHKPDLFITDIYMPEKDGLEMATDIQEMLPDSKFIVVTGYNHFEYAKRACKLNVVDFLLKPVKEDELLGAMRKAHRMILREHRLNAYVEEEQVLRVLRGLESPSCLYTLLQRDRPLQMFLLCNDHHQTIQTKSNIRKNMLVLGSLRAYLQRETETTVVVSPHEDRLICLIQQDISAQELLRNVNQYIYKKHGVTITAAALPQVDLTQIDKAYILLKQLIQRRFYQKPGTLISGAPPTWSIQASADAAIQQMDIACRAVDCREFFAILDRFWDICQKSALKPEMVCSQATAIAIMLRNNLTDLQLESEPIPSFQLARMHSIYDVKQVMEQYANDVFSQLREYRDKVEDTSIKRAITYIEQNYADPSISLASVAQAVYLSESYLSRKLTQFTGLGFSKFLLKLRIERAMALLRTGNSVLETANQVGYSDYRHFSRTFKRYTGYLPNEYHRGKHT